MWKYNTNYSQNEIVLDHNDNYNAYICKETHKSKKSPIKDMSNWNKFFVDNIRFHGKWSSTQKYSINSIVFYDETASLYISNNVIGSSSGNPETATGNWTKILDFSWIESKLITNFKDLYVRLDVLERKMKALKNGTNGINGTNGTDGTNGISIEYIGIWIHSHTYYINNIVMDQHDNDNMYICIKNHTSKKLKPHEDNEKWSLIIHSICFRGVWNKSITYKKNQIVIDNTTNGLYIARQTVLSNATPSKDTTNWSLMFSAEWIKPIDVPVGRPGRDGRDGISGKDGVDGKDGTPGKDGKNGKDGIDGINGQNGEPGRDGRDGTDGEKGDIGEKGKDGRDGKDGLDGKDGTDGKKGDPGINGRDGRDGRDGRSVLFKNIWQQGKSYKKGDLVIDPLDNNNIYICQTDECDQSTVPSNNTIDWNFFYGNAVIYSGEWKYGTKYKKNNIVYDKETNQLFICDDNPVNFVYPHLDNTKWSLFMPTIESTIHKSSLYGINVTQQCCTKYNTDKNVTLYDTSKCNHNINTTLKQVHQYTSYTITSKSMHIPINIIGQIVNTDISYDNNKIFITTPGLYKITYNICYHGSLFNTISCVTKTNNGNIELFTSSKNKSINRLSTDKTKESYYTDSTKKNINEITQYINHTFMAYINEKNTNEINLMLIFSSSSINKIIFIHPVETWMFIERVS